MQNKTMLNRIALFILISALYFLPQNALAHQNPSTILLLDVSPGKVGMELQIPLSQLELAYGHDISKNSEAELSHQSQQLKQYLLAHIHPTTPYSWSYHIILREIIKRNFVNISSFPIHLC